MQEIIKKGGEWNVLEYEGEGFREVKWKTKLQKRKWRQCATKCGRLIYTDDEMLRSKELISAHRPRIRRMPLDIFGNVCTWCGMERNVLERRGGVGRCASANVGKRRRARESFDPVTCRILTWSNFAAGVSSGSSAA